jgi:hypothetical protein
MPIHRLLKESVFEPEEITTMVAAYESVCHKLHDRGQPEVVNEIIAKRIVELGKLKTLNSDELSERVLNLFGIRSE